MELSKRRDPNEEAARLVRKATGKAEELPKDLEAAWEAWSMSIHSCDGQTRTLLREAFEAGYDAGSRMTASDLGKRGASKGGTARAAKLTKARRVEIARKAAKNRWGD